MVKSPLHVVGMHGLGDNLQQRAVIKQLAAAHEVFLETSWPSVYHDMPELHLLRRGVHLRTQTKNSEREGAKYDRPSHLPKMQTVQIMYHGKEVMLATSRTILEAMCRCAQVDYRLADFTLPVPAPWHAPLSNLIATWKRDGRPLLIYRPLTARPEWRGSDIRNADPDGYTKLFATMRDRFFVVSIADLEAGKEWLVGPQLRADAHFHKGELVFEQLAALFSLADLVYCSSGFGPLLAQAVDTPVISMIGGYHQTSAQQPPPAMAATRTYLGIDPIVPIAWQRNGDKRIDFLAASKRVNALLDVLEVPASTYLWTRFDMVYGPEVEPPAAPPITSRDMRAALLARQRAAIFSAARATGQKV